MGIIIIIIIIIFVVFTSVDSREISCCCAPNYSSTTENGVRLFGLTTDGERTQNGALYKPEVSSLHDLVLNSVDRGVTQVTELVSMLKQIRSRSSQTSPEKR